MTLNEILSAIHEQHIELEIYQELHNWILKDRSNLIDKYMNNTSTIHAIKNIATKNTNSKNALKGIIELCDDDI